MRDHKTSGQEAPSRRGPHARDLRFAGAVSAGLIATILACGALLAPVTNNFNTAPSFGPDGDESVVQLAPDSRRFRLARAPRRRRPG